MKNLIEYLGDNINSINIISLKQKGEIILSEDDKSAKLKELKIKYNVDDYDIFLMTLDVNNFIIKNKNEGIYSCFQIHTCSSMDYILFA